MSLLSPEAILMFFIAGMLDLFGIICLLLDVAFGIGEVLSFIPDVIGIVFIGGWILIRSLAEGKTMEEAKEEASDTVKKKMEEVRQKRIEKKAAKKIAKKGFRRFAIATLSELCPFLGNIAPSWTILVYLEVKNS